MPVAFSLFHHLRYYSHINLLPSALRIVYYVCYDDEDSSLIHAHHCGPNSEC